MTEAEAFAFLQEHQPMPDDEVLGEEEYEEEIDKYDEVRLFFMQHPNKQCIPLFLNSFGGKDGLGVYELIKDVILMYEKTDVLPHISAGLKSSLVGIKYWCIQLAADYPDESLFCPLVEALESDDEDIRSSSIIALEQLSINDIKKEEIIEILRKQMDKENDDDMEELIEEILLDLQS